MTDAARRPSAPRPEPRAPFVGREAELEALGVAARLARQGGRAQIVTVLGAAGVGKSRLVQEFVAGLQKGGGDPPVRIYRGSARETGASYGLFARMLRGRFGLLEGMDDETSRTWIRAQVAALLEDRKVGDVLYFLGQLLELRFAESPLTRALQDEPLQARLLRRAVLRRLLEADAATAPIVMVFEDLHAALPDELELVSFLLANLTGPVLCLCVTRSELLARQAAFLSLGGERHRHIDLGPLPSADAWALLEGLLSPAGVDAGPLIEAAASVGGGNPMLLERMVRVFHDTGVLEQAKGAPAGAAPRWIVHLERLEAARLPMTVEDAVEARIAALDPRERRLLEHAAAMGSVFWRGGLLALDRMDAPAPDLWVPDGQDGAEVDALVDELVSRDYVLQLPDSTFAGEAEYVFKHNKEREQVAGYVSPEERRRHHQAVADWLEHKTQVRSHEEHMAMLARHRELAGSGVKAAERYLEAGDIARERYAHQKASEYYAKGLGLLGDADAGRRLEALHHHGDVLALLGRADDARAQFREMLALAYRLDLVAKGGAAHNRIGRLCRDTGRLDEAARHLETSLSLFERADDERGIASSTDDLGKLHWLKGDYPRAQGELRRALAMRESLGDLRSIALSLNNLGLVLQDSGAFREAMDAFERALSLRREIGDLLGVVTSLNNIGTVAQDQGDHELALALFQEAYGVAHEVGDRNHLALVLTNIGETHYRLGRTEQAIEILKQAEELCDELGDKLGLAEAVRGLGKAYLLQGDLAKARACISRAVDLFTAVRSKVHLGIALRTLGEVTAAGGWGEGHAQKARDYYLRAMAIFEEIGNDIDLGRTLRAYAKFLRAAPAPGGEAAARAEADRRDAQADSIFARIEAALPPRLSLPSLPAVAKPV